MSEAKRVQRKRTKGWRMPKGAVYVGRPTDWGNPFVVDAVLDYSGIISVYSQPDRVEDRQHAVDLFDRWLAGKTVPRTGFGPIWLPRKLLNNLDQLRGRDLACWCPLDEPCHADVLLELANRATTPPTDAAEAAGGADHG